MNQNKLNFNPKYVAPFYGGLMNFNLLREVIVSDPKTFLNSVLKLEYELSDAEILLLLNSDWRPSKVGAWIIGLSKKYHLEQDLVDCLKGNPIYCEHIIIALSMLNTQSAILAIKTYIEARFNLILELMHDSKVMKAEAVFERHRITYGLAALQYSDKINGTKEYQDLGIASEIWNNVKEAIKRLSKENPRFETLFNLHMERIENSVIVQFDKLMKLIDNSIPDTTQAL